MTENDNTNKPIVYREGQRTIFRASAFAACIKSLVLARCGVEPAPPAQVLQRAFTRGQEAEPMIMAQCANYFQADVVDMQRQVELPIGKKAAIRGHIDGAMWIEDRYYPIDAKCFGESNFRSNRRGGIENLGQLGEFYAVQAWTYCMATDASEFVFAVNLADTDEVDFTVYDLDELAEIGGISYPKAIAKVAQVEKLSKEGSLLTAPCEVERFGCPYYPFHGGMDEAWWDDQLSDAEVAVVDALGHALASAREEEARAKAATSAARDALSARLEAVQSVSSEKGAKLKIEGPTVTVSRFEQTRKGIDKEAMIEDGIDLAKYETSTTSVQIRTVVKKVEEDAEEV